MFDHFNVIYFAINGIWFTIVIGCVQVEMIMSSNSTDKIDVLLAERLEMSQRLKAIDDQLLSQIREGAKSVNIPVSQAAVTKLIGQYAGDMSVKDICLIANLSPTTYYNMMSKLDTVKIRTLQSVLNTIGLELYVGEKNADARF